MMNTSHVLHALIVYVWRLVRTLACVLFARMPSHFVVDKMSYMTSIVETSSYPGTG